MSIEFRNHNKHEITLIGEDKQPVKIPPNGKVVLPEFFKRYVPRYLTIANGKDRLVHVVQQQRHLALRPRVINKAVVNIHRPQPPAPKSPPIPINYNAPVHTHTTNCNIETYPSIPNSILGVGILSYNRMSIRRLIESIRANTNMSEIHVYISDESTDQTIIDYLKTVTDMTVIHNSRVGISGNTNRLIRCLLPYNNKLLLNDDVEILKSGWDKFYTDACNKTGINHFCMRQPGLIGANRGEGSTTTLNGLAIQTIDNKPHGAVLYFNNKLFEKVGYFDEDFGLYGMEHVDWSERASLSGLQTPGFHDIVGSEQYFKINNEQSTITDKSTHLHQNRELLERKRQNRQIYIESKTTVSLNKKFSILVVSLYKRSDLLNKLLNVLYAQISKDVEVLINVDNGEKPIGKKRNELLKASTGDYIAFVDDDDLVSVDYVSEILQRLEHKPDCIGIEGIITINGLNPKVFKHSLKHKSWFEEKGVYYRCPNHLSPVKREFAMKTMFPEINSGEDRDYSMRLLPLLKSESNINKNIYNYLYVTDKR